MLGYFVFCGGCRYFFFFFFSSRRRHTRSLRDWSSDVCSSDLPGAPWRVRAEQCLKIGRIRRHRPEEQVLFRTKALIKNCLRDPRGARYLTRGRRVAALAEDLACPSQKFVVVDRLRPSHGIAILHGRVGRREPERSRARGGGRLPTFYGAVR